MKSLFIQKRIIIPILIGIMVMVSLYFYVTNDKQSTPVPSFVKKEKIWETVEINTAKDFASIKIPAKVKSNQFAIIAPRRAGIIQDLLVDIGDTVQKGQTIGSMLPKGVEGQSSAAINEARARLQKARSGLQEARGVAMEAVSVATKQWRESTLQSQTQASLDQEVEKQLVEKKSEALLTATQAWENTKLLLFGSGSDRGSRNILGNFSDAIQKNKVENLADEIQRMEKSTEWNKPDKILTHLSHIDNFLIQTEKLYKNAQPSMSINATLIDKNLKTIQQQQIRVSKIKQAILALEEKQQQFISKQAEKEAGADRAIKTLDLVQSQQNLTTTQAEKNVQVALANYNAALIKAGHQSITSPFSGTITARMVEVGQAVMMQTPLFYLEGAETAQSQTALSEIHFSLPESWENKVAVGDSIRIKTMEGAFLSGRIFRLSDQIDLKTNSIAATAIAFVPADIETEEASLKPDNKDLLDSGSETVLELELKPLNFPHGKSLFIFVMDNKSSVFTVPTLSLKKRSNQYFLWQKKEGEIIQLPVEVLAEDGEFSQISSTELHDKDLIISNPSVSLFTRKDT